MDMQVHGRTSMGTHSYPSRLARKSKIAWEKFIDLNCILRFNTATLDEYINFFVKVMDPYNRGLVPKEQFEDTLYSLFKGQF